ncbi:hypothetical protein IM816_18015 [Luteibacter flocculans]|uniref:P-type conjugative transfer protein TrbJ n=1 Tax=Luteibacter flocculans TaxID=2780091 RepID=A0ABY4T3I8_9GAMM|nr:hypothetical protein [Luteibacter flocculans]URL58453.1 hypothetical protein IM816_18015 [Luteibacter flocculans]
MKKRTKKSIRVAPAIAVLLASSTAQAGVLNVLDAANLVVNETTMFSNVAQNFQLTAIKHQLKSKDKGTVIHHTINIDKSALHIDKSTQNIDTSTTNIDTTTTNINKNIEINTEINNDFTWIINKEGGDEIIPIPFEKQFNKIMDGQTVDQYTGHYRTISDYESRPLANYADGTIDEASRARKAANDTLVAAIADDEKALRVDAENANAIFTIATSENAKGHAKQLQVANALAASELNQMMKLRAMMLASESARAAESQASADREARSVAVGRNVRSGLENAIMKAKLPRAAPN